MIKKIGDPEVWIEIDQPQGRIILVQCPEHGRMSEALRERAWICGDCKRTFSQEEAHKLIVDGYAEVRAADREQDRVEKEEQRRRLQERQEERRFYGKD